MSKTVGDLSGVQLYNQAEPMIQVVLKELPIETITFPDKTKTYRIDPKEWVDVLTGDDIDNIIFYYYTSLEDLMELKAITDLMAQNGLKPHLFIAYLPNARMDRIKSPYESYTLKSFMEFLKMLKVDTISIFDPHSDISNALLDNETYLGEIVATDTLRNVLESHVEKTFGTNEFHLAFPDAGSQKRYSDLIASCNFSDNITGVFVGNKSREWKTGVIKRVDVNITNGTWDSNNRNVLIVDDICSKGGTFQYFIEAMNKEYGDNINYYLYVSHMEPAILDGKLLDPQKPMVKNVLTTNSLSYHTLYKEDRYKQLLSNPMIKIESLEDNYIKLFQNQIN